MLAGGDADEHGCKPSTGEDWCASLGRCVLPAERCPGGTEQCQEICAELRAGKDIGYKTSCDCATEVPLKVEFGLEECVARCEGAEPGAGVDVPSYRLGCKGPNGPQDDVDEWCHSAPAGESVVFKDCVRAVEDTRDCIAAASQVVMTQLATEGEACCHTEVTPTSCKLPGCAIGLVCESGEASWHPGICRSAKPIVV